MSMPARRADTAIIILLAWACDGGTGPGRTVPLGPTINTFTVLPSPARIDDSVTVSYDVADLEGITYTEIVYEDAALALHRDSVAGGGASHVSRTVRIPTPSLLVDRWTVELQVVGHLRQETSDSVVLHFLTPPTMGGYYLGPDANPTALPGDTVRFFVGAGVGDLHDARITWLGYEVGPPVNARDSAPASGQNATDTFAVQMDRAWITGQTYLPYISFFARDAFGYRTRYYPACCQFLVIDAIRRPTVTVPLGGRVSDVVLDTTRGRLYLSQPDSGRILVLSIGTMTFETPIALSGRPSGMDLSLSGDSLLVGLYSTRELGVVNLVTGQIDRIPIVLSGFPDLGPDRVKEAANGKVFLSITFAGSGYGGQLIEYDLNTGQQRRRLEPGLSGALTEATGMARVGDASRLVLLLEDACCPVNAQTYTAAIDSFSPLHGVLNFFGDRVSSDRAGRYLLFANRLWTSDYQFVRNYAESTYVYRFNGIADESALSGDGAAAFFASLYGYYQVRLADDSVLERVRVSLKPNDLSRVFDRIVLLPDGQTLIGVGAYGVARVDLR